MNNKVRSGKLERSVAMLLKLGVQAVWRSIMSGTFFSEDLVMKNICTVILPLLLIQEEQLSVKMKECMLSTGKLHL